VSLTDVLSIPECIITEERRLLSGRDLSQSPVRPVTRSTRVEGVSLLTAYIGASTYLQRQVLDDIVFGEDAPNKAIRAYLVRHIVDVSKRVVVVERVPTQP